MPFQRLRSESSQVYFLREDGTADRTIDSSARAVVISDTVIGTCASYTARAVLRAKRPAQTIAHVEEESENDVKDHGGPCGLTATPKPICFVGRYAWCFRRGDNHLETNIAISDLCRRATQVTLLFVCWQVKTTLRYSCTFELRLRLVLKVPSSNLAWRIQMTSNHANGQLLCKYSKV
jgi:hypothetical protein